MPARRSLPLPSMRLMTPIYLPLGEINHLARTCLRGLEVYHQMPKVLLDSKVEELVTGLLEQWFVDPEGESLSHFVHQSAEYNTVMDDVIRELQEALDRLIRNTVGTFVPSLRYRYEIQTWREILIITPTLPTLDDYDQRMHALASGDAFIPSRFRR